MSDILISPRELLDRTTSRLETLLLRVCEDYAAPHRVAAAFFLHMYTWAIAEPAVSSYVRERRVPDVAADKVLLRFDERGRPGKAILLSRRFAALASDDASSGRDAVPLRDERDLVAWFHRRMIDENLESLVEVLRAQKLLGYPALWGIVSDTCADAFVSLSRSGEDLAQVLHSGQAFLKHPDSPVAGRTTLFMSEVAGRRSLFYRRAACCLAYLTTLHAYCDNCPLLDAQERERRLLARLEAT